MTDELIITAKDIRGHYCPSGVRAWFRSNNLDFMSFLKTGIHASVLEATGDPVALDIVAAARRRSADGK